MRTIGQLVARLERRSVVLLHLGSNQPDPATGTLKRLNLEFGFWDTLGGSENFGFGTWSCRTRESEIWAKVAAKRGNSDMYARGKCTGFLFSLILHKSVLVGTAIQEIECTRIHLDYTGARDILANRRRYLKN